MLFDTALDNKEEVVASVTPKKKFTFEDLVERDPNPGHEAEEANEQAAKLAAKGVNYNEIVAKVEQIQESHSRISAYDWVHHRPPSY